MTSPTIATADEQTQRDVELTAVQYDFVYDDEHKFPAYIGGIGAGKTFAGGVKAIRNVIEQPGSLGLIGAPTYAMLRDSTMRSVFAIFPPALIDTFNKTDGLLTLINGSEILFRSADDPERLRSMNLAWFWLDEAPLCGYPAWQILKGRLRQAGYRPQGWATGTPHGEDRFYQDFEQEPQPGHKLYRASTRENAHNLPPGYIEDLGYTGKFAQQEIEGLFVTFEGLVYEFRSDWHMGEWPTAQVERQPALKIGGVDWGFTNPAVALPFWVDGDDRVFQRDEYYERQAGLAGVKDAVRRFTRDYGITTWYCGPDEPEHIAELNALFGSENLKARAVAATDDITPGVETVRRQMTWRGDDTSGLRLSARCVQTRAEYRTYSYPAPATNGGGKRDPQEKPVKKFDHAMDATRYALHSALGSKTRHRELPAEAMVQRAQRMSDIGGFRIMKKVF